METPEDVNFSKPLPQASSNPTTSRRPPPPSTGAWIWKPTGSSSAAKARPSTSAGSAAQKAEAGFIQQDVQNAASKPVKMKKSMPAAEGSHLAQATKTTPSLRNQGTSQVQDSIMVFDPATRTFQAKPREKPAEPEPRSPTTPQVASTNLKPGTFDPSTRTIVPIKPQTSRTASGESVSSDAATGIKMKKQRPSLGPGDTSPEPPPKNPARYSPSSSPSPSRGGGYTMLHKQPSMVREDPEGEEKATAGEDVVQSKQDYIQTSAGPAKKYTAPKSAHQRAVSLDVPRPSVESGNRGRHVSMSPSRSAHFSPSPVMEFTRHEPPLRSVSPAKSAMKHVSSPASSIRKSSPMVPAQSSDVSDTTSVASQEGVLPKKKKKSVRVSFDDKAEEVEAASVAVQSNSLARERSPAVEDEMEDLMKPRPALPSFGSIRKTSGRQEPEVGEKVTEVPPERQEQSSDHAVGGILATNHADKADADAPLPPEVTSREVAGYASDESEEDFKPETTSTPAKVADTDANVEDTSAMAPINRDFASDTSGGLMPHNNDDGHVPEISLHPPTPGEDAERNTEGKVPPRSSYDFDVPGSSADSDHKTVSASPNPSTESSSAMPNHSEAVAVPTEVVAAPPVAVHQEAVPAAPAVVYQESEPEVPLEIPEVPLDIIDEDSDDSAAFSDAAEDPSQLDEGVFASLNAILESPVANSAEKVKAIATPEGSDSPLAKKTVVKDEQAIKDWTAATAYWAQLSKQQRDQIEREALSSDDEARPQPAAEPKPKKRISKPQYIAAGDEPQDEAPVQSRGAAAVGSTTAMPKTLRAKPGPTPAPSPAPAAPTDRVAMRRSLRDSSGGGGMASSMRSGPPSQRPQSQGNAPSRPVSGSGPSTSAAGDAMRRRAGSNDMRMPQEPARPNMERKRSSQQSLTGATVPPPGHYTAQMQKQYSRDDSDSESSFKKKRRTSTVDGAGRYTMKRSMRGGPGEQVAVDQRPSSPSPVRSRGGGGFGMRSLSPSGSMFSDSGRGQKLRGSLRSGSVGPPEPKRATLRGAQPAGKAGRSSSARPASTSGAAGRGSAFRSRFSRDSDEEDEPKSKKSSSFFKSRFADSDDDEPSSPRHIPADLTPVRGIPRRKGQYDGDSTDLSDEEFDDPRKASRKRNKQNKPGVPNSADIENAMAAARRNLGMVETDGAPHEANQGSALSKGSLRKPAVEQAEPQSPTNVQQDANIDAATPPKRRGFMGSILRRNRNSQMSIQQLPPGSPTTSSQVPPTPQIPASYANPPSSFGGKLVRRGSQQPSIRRGDSYMSNITAPTSGGPAEQEHDWPMPNGNRPATSDGPPNPEAIKLARTMRGPAGMNARPKSSRVGFAAGSKEDDGDVAAAQQQQIYSSKTGRKKRFPMLRKAFGLHD